MTHIVDEIVSNIKRHSMLSSDELKLEISYLLNQCDVAFSELAVHDQKNMLRPSGNDCKPAITHAVDIRGYLGQRNLHLKRHRLPLQVVEPA